jgi:16S rRNA (cytosine967-C5)-methyltransferase
MVRRWTSQFDLDVARRICIYDQSIPVTSIRLRSLSAEEELTREGISLAPGIFLASARRVVSGDVTKTKACIEGLVAIQDEASQLVAALVGKGSRILDCCAAPGGKTWSIADRNPQATVTAVELHGHRAELLTRRVRAANVQVVNADIRELPVGEPFDRVLVDAPCSGTGTIARNPEIKWRLRPDDLVDLQIRQRAILQAAMKHVGQEGRLIYSTCSLEPEENERVIEDALRAEPSFRVMDIQEEIQRLKVSSELLEENNRLITGPFLRTVPGVHVCDGFFVALLERSAE